MARRLAKAFAALTLAVLAYIATGGAMTAVAGPLKPRGQFVDIGGRHLRIVCEGPDGAKATVLMESGAFGFSADFGAVQQKLAAHGVRSCAYDRAGMGWSDPGPQPRDSDAIVGDLEKLLAAKGEAGPFILMGHSMAGLHVRLFAARNPDKVAGLVLIEAAVADINMSASVQKFVKAFVPLSNAAAVVASAGLLKPLNAMGEHIGLPPDAAAEKRRAFASGKHNRTAAAEVRNWNRSAAQAAAAAPYRPEWPVAVILAGDEDSPRNQARALPERQARHGYFEAVPGAGHASVLGLKWNDAVVRGVDFVIKNAAVP